MNPSISAPLALLRAGEQRFPGIYRVLDRLAQTKPDGEIDWPDYCALPISAAFTTLTTWGYPQQEAAQFASQLTGAWTWNKNRVIYRYDPTLVQTLAEQADDMEDTDVLPCDLLLHLPYPCIYIQCPGLYGDMDGALIWIEWDESRKSPEYRVQYILDDGNTFPGVLHLIPGGTIADCIRDTDAEISRHTDLEAAKLRSNNELVRLLLVTVQLTLYLLSDGADVQMRPAPKLSRRRNKSKGTSKRPDPEQPVQHGDVGIHIGAAIRRQTSRPAPSQSTGAGTGSPKRPHTRRGHWHHYWTGAHDSPDRKLVLRWTAPTLIHPDDGSDTITIYPVN